VEREELGAAKVACKTLSDGLDAAKAALSEAEHAASEAAEPVMLSEAERPRDISRRRTARGLAT
jgi:hypothetical protein